jgi:hypothetical protein
VTPLSATLARETPMIQTVEAVIDEHGNVKLLEPVRSTSSRRALVTILEAEACPWGCGHM